jgi:hypothetical protein
MAGVPPIAEDLLHRASRQSRAIFRHILVAPSGISCSNERPQCVTKLIEGGLRLLLRLHRALLKHVKDVTGFVRTAVRRSRIGARSTCKNVVQAAFDVRAVETAMSIACLESF